MITEATARKLKEDVRFLTEVLKNTERSRERFPTNDQFAGQADRIQVELNSKTSQLKHAQAALKRKAKASKKRPKRRRK